MLFSRFPRKAEPSLIFPSKEKTQILFAVKTKVKAFIKKINIWKRKVENDLFEVFPFAEKFLDDNNLESDIIKPNIISHLSSLLKDF